jgi:adenine-specific DNA-methyltransferase
MVKRHPSKYKFMTWRNADKQDDNQCIGRCKNSVRLAVVQKFNEAYNWKAKTCDDLKNHLTRHRTPSSILEFNNLINSLRICDPAVGAGQCLVAVLHELIAIKADLKLLADQKGVPLTDHVVTIVQHELVITHHQTQEIFEYPVIPAAGGKGFAVAPEIQRLQKTLFHEKKHIIENCLFGMDTDAGSVKTCRLRLRQELLKNAYYLVETGVDEAGNSSPVCYADAPDLREEFTQPAVRPELLPVPEIDIHVRQGNPAQEKDGNPAGFDVVIGNRDQGRDSTSPCM